MGTWDMGLGRDTERTLGLDQLQALYGISFMETT